MPLIIPTELPTADIAIVFPPGEGEVMMFIDPRVPVQIANDTIARVHEALYGCGGNCIAQLAELAQGCVHAVG